MKNDLYEELEALRKRRARKQNLEVGLAWVAILTGSIGPFLLVWWLGG